MKKKPFQNNNQLIQLETLKQSLIPNFSNLSQQIQQQMNNILKILLQKNNFKLIQQISRYAILQECPLLRLHIWKLLLGSLPIDATKWSEVIDSNYKFYQSLVQRIFPQNLLIEQQSSSKNSISFDEQLWQEIALDTKRTHSVLNFFKNELGFVKMFRDRPTRHADLLGRILYVWGKVNPKIRYVQGMNQILAPLYYLQFQAQSPYNQSQVYFIFSALMNFSIDMHSKQLDGSQFGIMGRINTLNRYLKVVDLEIWSKLQNQHVLPQHYTFRWLALLLSQQFQLQDTMRIWDVLFSYEKKQRFFFLYCICLAIIKARKQYIMNSDLIGILPKLQKLKDLQTDELIQYAIKLYDKYSKVSIERLYDKIDAQIKQREKLALQKLNKSQQKSWNYGNLLKSTTSFIVNQFSYLKNNQS